MSEPFDSEGWHVMLLRVPLHEVDLGMAVYHGNYYHLFQVARDEFLRDAGFSYKRIMDLELHLTIVETHCEYRKALHYDDLVQVHTRPSWMRTRSLGMEQKITRRDDSGKALLCTRLSLGLVCVTFQGLATRIPKELAACLQKYLAPS